MNDLKQNDETANRNYTIKGSAMTELGDYQRMVERPMLARIAERETKVAAHVQKMDKLLARAADALNNSPRMSDMDLGSEITEFRRKSQQG